MSLDSISIQLKRGIEELDCLLNIVFLSFVDSLGIFSFLYDKKR